MNAPEQMQNVGEIDRRDIPGYEGVYAVTREGRVWAYPRRWRTGAASKIERSSRGSYMKAQRAPNCYLVVNLCRDGNRKTMTVHRLVAAAWIPNPRDLPQVNHLNSIKSDNRVENLEWCTAAENRKHAFASGRITFSDNFLAAVKENAKKAHEATRKLTYAEADQVRARFAGGETKTAIARAFGIERSTVWSIINGRTYVR